MDGSVRNALQNSSWMGRAMPRREDDRLLRGQGVFVDDLQAPDCVFLEVLRSPYPAGRITALDVTEASGMDGVIAIYTAADITPQADSAVNALLPGAELAAMEPLARTHVRAAGQAVAAIIATSRDRARDAAEAIWLEVEGEPAPTRARTQAHWGQTLPAFDNPVRASIAHALVAPFAMEPRAVFAMPEGTGLTVWLSTQTPQRGRDDLCAMLGLDRDQLRVIAPDVGGAFGGKASLMPEDYLTAFAALTLQRPVKWAATRSDEFLAATQGRGASSHAEMAVDATGRATGLRAEFTFPLGHWMPYSALAPVRNAGRILPGPYTIPCDVTAAAETTEGAAVNIYRGAGRPEAAMILERLMDRAAQRLGIDPMDMRRRNVTTRLAAQPDTPCSGDFPGLLDRLEQETGYRALRAAQSQRRAQGVVCGLGLALYVEPCGQGLETASLRLCEDGRFLAITGSSAQGQGRETAMAQIVAQALNLHPQQITVSHGDTALAPEGIGALASRSTAIGGAAMWRAASGLLDRAATLCAPLLGCAPADVVTSAEGVCGGGNSLGWADLAAHLGADPLVVHIRHEAAAEAWASGAILAEVVIDPETGVLTIERMTWVDDAGIVINPVLVQGQLLGGAAQGIGAATMERMVYADGQLQTGSLMDYALPRATDMPPIHLFSQPTPSPANPLGVKGVGEAGCIGIPAAILNAVMDALPQGTPDLTLPLTSEKLWRALTGSLQ
ncbi:xanthine dehydrogenase family protein molybdopterin-binding subunit [Pseudorhodobacter sp. E13]|uniref:xanthine dehydrogenase family protein molybdopterin-binding subunit n=1 Tax=Pseudorhodobacter sp. E13 TaxID=2487931 RepID=UPI000F8E311B|nr:xanthine dehydrogenase family protein molybdopterin-binding subunit [Pseudorhodobacter sp. E13]RUS58992.1 xanthine dehydrogenase family protein molybdopterin-binding subunit [Pseudorhodobacter sp. E13]